MPFVTSRDGTRIGYTTIGTGPALILVDGAMCWRASGPATPLAEQLKDRFTVYTYDRRGRGESGDTKPYATAREVEDLDAVIAAAGGSALVYAISSGAALALEAAGNGSAISKMVLYEAPFITERSRPLIDAGYVARMAEFVARGDHAGAIKLFMREGVQIPAFAVFMMQLMGMMKKMAPVAPTLPYDTALTAPFQAGEPLPANRWSKATMPVLCVGGGKSDAWMQNAQKAIAAVLPHAQHRTLDGQNHMVAPTAIAPLIKEFLA